MQRLYFFIFAILLLLLATLRVVLYKPQMLPKSQPVKFEAVIEQEPRVYDDYRIIYVGDSKVYTDLYPAYRIGDRLVIEGKFDDQGRMFRPKVEKVGHKRTIFAFFSRFRERLSQNMASLLSSREATLLVGTVLGVDTISEEFREELIKTGTIHVVVVSGQNLTLVAGVFLALSKYIGKRKSMVLATIAVFAYSFLTGFEPPVVRASIMVVVASLAVFWGRESSVIWSIFIAAIVIVLIWPHSVFEISFQLTFAATLGIVTLGKKLQEFFKKLPVLGENAAIATSAYLFTAPIIFFHFSRVSPIAPIANILVAEAVFPIMVLGFLVALSSLIFMPLAQVLAFVAYVPTFYFVEVVHIMAKIPTPF